MLVNITASDDFGIQEMNDAIDLIQGQAHEEANIIVGLVHNPSTTLRLKGGVHALKHGLESHQLGSCLRRRRCRGRRIRCPVEGSLCATTVGRSRYRAACGTATRPVRHGRTRHEAQHLCMCAVG